MFGQSVVSCILAVCPLGQKYWPTTDFFIGPRCPWGPIYGSGSLYVRDVFADLTDVTLVDEDTKSILTDNANRAIQGNQSMHVTYSGVQIC